MLTSLFIIFLVGQALAGHRHYNEEQIEHGQPAVSMTDYLTSGEFLEATAENWESEFLQMAAYVLLTSFLFQRGSAESKKIGSRKPSIAIRAIPGTSAMRPRQCAAAAGY